MPVSDNLKKWTLIHNFNTKTSLRGKNQFSNLGHYQFFWLYYNLIHWILGKSKIIKKYENQLRNSFRSKIISCATFQITNFSISYQYCCYYLSCPILISISASPIPGQLGVEKFVLRLVTDQLGPLDSANKRILEFFKNISAQIFCQASKITSILQTKLSPKFLLL